VYNVGNKWIPYKVVSKNHQTSIESPKVSKNHQTSIKSPKVSKNHQRSVKSPMVSKNHQWSVNITAMVGKYLISEDTTHWDMYNVGNKWIPYKVS
jgi:hypothetical protein